MKHISAAEFEVPGGASLPAFDPVTLAELVHLLPPHRIDVHFEALVAEIEAFLAPDACDALLQLIAHQLVSLAGMLGFLKLSSACIDLQSTGSDWNDRLELARAAAQAALGEIATLRASARLDS